MYFLHFVYTFPYACFCLLSISFLFSLFYLFWFYKQDFSVIIFLYVSLYAHACISLRPVPSTTVSSQKEFLFSAL